MYVVQLFAGTLLLCYKVPFLPRHVLDWKAQISIHYCIYWFFLVCQTVEEHALESSVLGRRNDDGAYQRGGMGAKIRLLKRLVHALRPYGLNPLTAVCPEFDRETLQIGRAHV